MQALRHSRRSVLLRMDEASATVYLIAWYTIQLRTQLFLLLPFWNTRFLSSKNKTYDEAERNMTVVLISVDVSGYVVAEREVCCQEMAIQSPQTLFDCMRQGTLRDQTTRRSAYIILYAFLHTLWTSLEVCWTSNAIFDKHFFSDSLPTFLSPSKAL